DLALALVQTAQERALAVELAAGILVPHKHPVVGCATQHGMADLRRSAILDVVADRIAAARTADQCDARSSGPAFQCGDRLRKLAALVFARRALVLRDRVVAARKGIGEIDREHALARDCVRFHAPDRSDPEGGMITIAVDE